MKIELIQCDSAAEVDEYGKVYTETLGSTQQVMEDMTGCKVPCDYQHFSLVGEFDIQVLPNSNTQTGSVLVVVRIL